VTKSAASFSGATLATIAFAAFSLLAGCGIKGPLDLPEGTQTVGNEGRGQRSTDAMKNTQLPGYNYQLTPGDLRANKALGNPIKRDEPFVLDPLLN
jgi:predicted small lipoprotein YifL